MQLNSYKLWTNNIVLYTLVLLNPYSSFFENTVYQEQVASNEAIWLDPH